MVPVEAQSLRKLSRNWIDGGAHSRAPENEIARPAVFLDRAPGSGSYDGVEVAGSGGALCLGLFAELPLSDELVLALALRGAQFGGLDLEPSYLVLQPLEPSLGRHPKARLLVELLRKGHALAESEEDFYVGGRQDVLRRVDGAWKIARRKLTLDQNVLSAKNVSIFF